MRTVYFGIPASKAISFMNLVIRTASLLEKLSPWRPAGKLFLDIIHYADAWRWIMVARTRLNFTDHLSIGF